jgi:hypothetical protein
MAIAIDRSTIQDSMSISVGEFLEKARSLTRGPLGIIALFIGLIYAMASIVLTVSNHLSSGERLPLVYFLATFPYYLLTVVAWLVAKYPKNLYPPGEYANEQNFVALMGGHLAEWRQVWTYRDLDFLYLEVLKIAIENPRFIIVDLIGRYRESFTGEERARYDAYAFLTWNVCETIFDRRQDVDLFTTWFPILRVQNKLHRAWFEFAENRLGFKESFQKYILANTELQPPQVPAA